MKTNKILIILILLFCFPFSCLAGTYYLDNELTTGANDGSSWEDAFQSVSAVIDNGPQSDNDGPHILYMKATLTPYRESVILDYIAVIYGDATGVGVIRGNSRSMLYGSDIISNWTHEGAGVYSTTDLATAAISFLTASESVTDRGVYLANDPPVALSRVSTTEALVDADYSFYFDGADKLYVYLNGLPPVALEVSSRTGLECFSDAVYEGLDIKYAINGEKNPGCTSWIIRDCDFSFNSYYGINTQASSAVETPALVENCLIHDNGNGGFYWSRISAVAACEPRIELKGNVIYNNSGEGVRFFYYATYVTMIPDYMQGDFFKLTYNTITNNEIGVLFESKENQPTDVAYPIAINVKHNIVWGNQTDINVSIETDNFTFSNAKNCFDPSKSATWEAYQGADNVLVAPLFNKNFTLKPTSPCKNIGPEAGVVGLTGIQKQSNGHEVMVGDHANVDIGAYLFDHITGIPRIMSGNLR